MEQQTTYDLLLQLTNKFAGAMDNNNFWNKLSSENKTALIVSHYFCPSRRGPSCLADNAPYNGQGGFYGPQGDYAYVVGAKRTADSGNSGSWFTIEWREGTGLNAIDDAVMGPVRLAKRTTENNSSTWYPRDDFSWWQDGTSNQIVIGEKFIPQDYIDKCSRFEEDSTGAYCLDCSMLTLGSHWSGHSVSRSFNSPLATGPHDYKFNATTGKSSGWYSENYQPHWGGCHAGVANFLLGDGSVRAISVTTPQGYLYSSANNEATNNPTNSIIGRLGYVSDGYQISNL